MKFKQVMVYVLIFIIVVNLTGFFISTFTNTSLIVKIKTVERAYILAHGGYVKDGDNYSHKTNLDGENIETRIILDRLREEGYSKIWISMCEQGDSDYIISYNNGTKIEWGEDISRIHNSGNIYPIYLGFGFYRIALEDSNEI